MVKIILTQEYTHVDKDNLIESLISYLPTVNYSTIDRIVNKYSPSDNFIVIYDNEIFNCNSSSVCDLSYESISRISNELFIQNMKIVNNLDDNAIVIDLQNKENYDDMILFILENDIEVKKCRISIDKFFDKMMFIYNKNEIYVITKYYYDIFFTKIRIVDYNTFSRKLKLKKLER